MDGKKLLNTIAVFKAIFCDYIFARHLLDFVFLLRQKVTLILKLFFLIFKELVCIHNKAFHIFHLVFIVILLDVNFKGTLAKWFEFWINLWKLGFNFINFRFLWLIWHLKNWSLKFYFLLFNQIFILDLLYLIELKFIFRPILIFRLKNTKSGVFLINL